MRIMIANSGSSSLKLSIIEDDDITAKKGNFAIPDRGLLKTQLRQFLQEAGPLDAVAHRIVHGGSLYRESLIVDKEKRAELQSLSELAPLHNPVALEMMDVIGEELLGVQTVACFDTAFNKNLPKKEYTYAIPEDISRRYGIRRFGFHGLSCTWSSREAKKIFHAKNYDRLIICHIGAGASITAVRKGRSVATTMGYTPLEGLIMATRSGDIDPGIIFFLAKRGYTVTDIEEILDKRSGLAALVPGSQGDMLHVLELFAKDDPTALMAVDKYTDKIAGEIAALAVTLSGLGSLVFTGGIGEGSPLIRQLVAEKIGFLGLEIDKTKNFSYQGGTLLISEDSSKIEVAVAEAREDLVMAAEARSLIQSAPGQTAELTDDKGH